MTSRWIAFLVLGCATVATAAVGCGGSDDDAKSDEHTHSDADSLKSADCKAITTACHDKDTGKGEIAACHTTAHSDDATKCGAAKAACITACK